MGVKTTTRTRSRPNRTTRQEAQQLLVLQPLTHTALLLLESMVRVRLWWNVNQHFTLWRAVVGPSEPRINARNFATCVVLISIICSSSGVNCKASATVHYFLGGITLEHRSCKLYFRDRKGSWPLNHKMVSEIRTITHSIDAKKKLSIRS